MDRDDKTAALWIGGAALIWLLWRARTQVGGSLELRFPQGLLAPEDFPEFEPVYPLDPYDYWEGEFLGPSREVAAFLYMIRRAEHTAADVASGRDYMTFYGGTSFSNMSDHPVITGEKSPVRLKPEQCRRLGYASGVCVSTAAGAYQFIRPTWNALRAGPPRLPSFAPEDQDLAAVRLLQRIGALDLIKAGRIGDAIQTASTQWASLPGSTAGQGGRTMAEVESFYTDAGGTFA